MYSCYLAILDRVGVAELLALAVTVALSPVPIAAVVVILASRRARPNGLAFVGGWAAGIAAVGAAVLLLADQEPGNPTSETADVLKLTLGVVLIVLAAQQWRSRPRGDAPARDPRWLRTVDELTAWRTAGLGMLLAAVYPKTVLLVATAAATMAETTSGPGDQVAVLAGFVLVGTTGVALPVAIQLVLGERSEPTLARLRGWLSRNSGIVLPVLFLLIAAILIADSAPDLLG